MISTTCKHHEIKTGKNRRFPKENPPYNKGKKGLGSGNLHSSRNVINHIIITLLIQNGALHKGQVVILTD